jgi:hypothetical protein
MIVGFDPGALLARSYVLPRGPRVCLRLARSRDLAGLRQLFERQEAEADELELIRLTRADPRRRLVICATALVGGSETVVGVGAIQLGGGETGDQPELVLVDEPLTEGLGELLSDALVGRARALTRARALAPSRSRAA